MSLDQFWSFVVDYGGTGLVLVIIIGGIVGLYKAWPMLVKFISVGSAVADLPETIKDLRGDICELSEKVAVIKKEVLPNGGSSLRDAVNRTETQLGTVAKTVEEHSKKLGA